MEEIGLLENCQKKNTLVTYEELSLLTKVDPSNRLVDELLLSAAHSTADNYTHKKLREEYDNKTVPDDLREGIINLYVYKRNVMQQHGSGQITDEQDIALSEMLPPDVKGTLDYYRKVTL